MNSLGVTAPHIPDVATPPPGVHTAYSFSPFPTSPVFALSSSSSLTKQKLTATSLTASNLSRLVTQLSVVEERSRSGTDRSGNPGTPDSGWLDKRRTKALGKKEHKSKAKMGRSISVERLGQGMSRPKAKRVELTRRCPVDGHEQRPPAKQRQTMLAVSTGALPKDMPVEPIFVEPGSVKTKRLNAG